MSSRKLLRRSGELEILDLPVESGTAEHAYRQLAFLHRCLGDTAAVVNAVRRDRLPVRRILEVGCAGGEVLYTVARKLGIEAIGVDLRPLAATAPVRIVRADAVCDALPRADVAFSMHTAHHLDEGALIRLIQNVGRSCRRFLVIDVVRHALPEALFRALIAPFAAPVVAADGLTSFRRAYTPEELWHLAETALAGTSATFHCSVAPLKIRQMLDIRYEANTMPGTG